MSQSYFSYSQHLRAVDPKPVLEAAIAREFYLADAELACNADRMDATMDCEKAMAGSIPMFRATMTGPITSQARRTWQNIREDGKRYYVLWLASAGTIEVQQNGHDATANPDEFLFTSTGKPFKVAILPDDDGRHVSYQIALPTHLTNSFLPDIEQICARAFAWEAGGAPVARFTLVELFDRAEHVTDEVAHGFIRASLQAIGSALQTECEATREANKIKNVRLSRILDHIEFNLSSPGLTAGKVATACGISSRYLHLLLKESGLNYHDYVWSRRLKIAHEWLARENGGQESITQIACKAGFRSISHFSRVFKECFGYTPSQLKKGEAGRPTPVH